MARYKCSVCDWVYDESIGDPANGIAPGTKFAELPGNWICPMCGATKDLFELLPEA